MARAVAENMSGIFNGGDFIGVVNAPDLGQLTKQPHAIPYILLAEKIGSMQAQLLKSNKIGSITINLRGKDISDSKLADIIKAAVLKGALEELVEQTVTYINANSIADELGLKVQLNLSEQTEAGSGYVNSMAVELEIEGFLNLARVIEGAVFGTKDIRITKIDGFTVELPPGENMLLFNNFDHPGVVKRVAEKLAQANINIAHFSLGRKGKGKQALGAFLLDTPADETLLASLPKYADVTNVNQVSTIFTFPYLL